MTLKPEPKRQAVLAGAAALAARPAFAAARALSSEGYLTAPGGQVYWRKVGQGPGTPILLLHGGPGAGHNYLEPLGALGDQREVIFYDQLGCGRSDSPSHEDIYTVQRAVDEVEAVRRALGLSKVILFGHSWGSMLAIEYICQGKGAGVSRLVLGGALASTPQAAAGQQRLIAALPGGAGSRMHALEAEGRTDSKEYADLVQLFYDLHVCRKKPLPRAAAESFKIVQSSIAYRVMNGPNEFTITGVIKDWDRRSDLGLLRMPTLVTTGAFDEVTLDCHQTIVRGAADAHLEVFKEASHMTMNERPRAYTAAVRRFISPA